MHYQLDETWIPFSSLMLKHVYNVLLICSDYDRFMLEEDGRVEEELYKEYTALQKLCLQILRQEEIKYGIDSDKVYGILLS